MSNTIPERIKEIRAGIPENAVIVAAAKGRSVESVRQVIGCGITDIGENRVQEALGKYEEIGKNARWHMIGPLQRNKVKKAVGIFDMIQSVDSLKLASEIDRRASEIGKRQDILLEVNISREPQKHGFAVESVSEAAVEISKMNHLRLCGLMTMAPEIEPEMTRPYFREMKLIFDSIKAQLNFADFRILSMGMTNDYKIALQEGSNMIRLGRAIFGG